MIDEERYLDLLGIKKSSPSLALLTEIVKRHLASVPYENISKLIRFHEVGPSGPDFKEFVAGIAEKTYGGTCFAQNIHLNRLLNYLGFKSKLVSVRREGLLSHVSLRVDVSGINYLVDVGIMSSIAGPYRIHSDYAFDTQVGNQRYVYTPSSDSENCLLEIHRGGKMIRTLQTSSEPFTENELTAGIQKTFEPGAMFMTTLCVHRAFENHSIGIWNNHLYRVEGTDRVVRDLRNFSELEEAFFKDLNLPNYPLKSALKLLEAQGVPKLF